MIANPAGVGDVRIAIVSPFVDRQHGTERALAELLDRLSTQHRDSIDLYAQNVSDLKHLNVHPGKKPSNKNDRAGILWHQVPRVPGPHLIQFLSWLILNRWSRWRLKRSDFATNVVFSPGINALDADVILVHAIFHRVAEIHKDHISSGLRGLHRKLYYALLCSLERRIYRNPRITLAAVSRHTADQLAKYFGRNDVTVIPNGVDTNYFSPGVISAMRETNRQQWNISSQDFVLLLVGNDWRNKGLKNLLHACAQCRDLPLRLFVVGQDAQQDFRAEAKNFGLADRVQFFSPVPDVRVFYSAADALVAPSLEDSFNLPVLEAMSCGLPVIASARAGVSEWLTDQHDSIVLKNPEDTQELAGAIRLLATNPAQRGDIARNGSHTAKKFSWDAHASELRKLLVKAAELKSRRKRPAKSI